MIKTNKKFTLKELENMTWMNFKKMINGIYPLESCTFEFPEGIQFEVFVNNIDFNGEPTCRFRTSEFNYTQFNEAIKEYLFCKENYEKDDIPCYINLTVFYPGVNEKGNFAHTLMFDYIY